MSRPPDDARAHEHDGVRTGEARQPLPKPPSARRRAQHPVRRVTTTVAALLAATAIAYAGIHVLIALAQSDRILRAWASERVRPAGEEDIVLVALGDSAMQGIGASSASHTIAGLLAQRIADRTERNVIVHNYATGGGTVADILSDQLPHTDLDRADLVIVASSNDLEQRVNPRRYAADAAQLASRLPTGKTIWSDLPLLPGRAGYQRILHETADGAGIARADFASAFQHARSLFIFSWLPPHVNDRGYALWAGAFEPAVDRMVDRLSG